jgi:hypothetical protein
VSHIAMTPSNGFLSHSTFRSGTTLPP